MIITKHIIRYTLIGTFALLSACSSDYDNYVYQRPQAPPLLYIPEVASVRVEQAPQYIPPPVKPKSISNKVKKERIYKPKVKKYSPYKISNTVITQKEVSSVSLEKQWEKAEKEAEKNAIVDVDPYANIPERRPEIITRVKSTVVEKKPVRRTIKPSVNVAQPSIAPVKSSLAVKSLLVKARADLAIGRTSSAIGKLERGLRIEPRNSDLWYQLAKTHYAQKDYAQTVNMAKKSIRNTNRDYVIAKNWLLIKKAGLKSGDTVVVKEAIDYFKVNP